ncbi:hypothetical protein BZA77DRAFT_297939 [Pyronema omphalodes]|nr:hypothetical protein BZA77DRAFT_297939 [Pyronema omphalodes]
MQLLLCSSYLLPILLLDLFLIIPTLGSSPPAMDSDMTLAKSDERTEVDRMSNSVKLQYCIHKDWLWCKDKTPNDWECYQMEELWDNQVSSYRVKNGCCAFYNERDCTKELFSATNRSHGKIGKWHNDKISSYKCGRSDEVDIGFMC